MYAQTAGLADMCLAKRRPKQLRLVLCHVFQARSGKSGAIEPANFCTPQAWQTVHLPKRGSRWQQPKVHIGFYKSWRKNNLYLRVKQRIITILNSQDVDKHNVKLYVTGARSPGHFVRIVGPALPRATSSSASQLRMGGAGSVHCG
jgi:hypothetical protein